MNEPMMELLLPQLREAGVRVDELWTVDLPMSGQTAMVNPVGYLYGAWARAIPHIGMLD